MDLKFIIAQIVGAIGLFILIISVHKNNKEKLLKYQIFSTLIYAIQFLLLDAFSGFLMNIVSVIRNIIFKKFEDKVPVIYLIIVIIAMLVLSIFSYDGPISLLPTIAVILYSIALWQKNLTITRIAEILSCILFMIYNVKVLAITGMISVIIEILFVLIAIYRFDVKGKNIFFRKVKNEG